MGLLALGINHKTALLEVASERVPALEHMAACKVSMTCFYGYRLIVTELY